METQIGYQSGAPYIFIWSMQGTANGDFEIWACF